MNPDLISGIYGDKGVRCPNTKSLYFLALSIFWHFYASSHSGVSYPPNTIFQADSSKQNGENFDCQNISSGKTTSGTICLTLKLHNRETFGPNSSLNVQIWILKRTFLLESEIWLKIFKEYMTFFIHRLALLKNTQDFERSKSQDQYQLPESGSSYWPERGHAFNLIKPIIALRKIFTATRLHSGLLNNYRLNQRKLWLYWNI